VPCGARVTYAERSSMDGSHTTRQDFASLYHRAFAEFGVIALWNLRELSDPAPQDALAITRSLRVEGDLRARRLAEELERACRAAL